jgi:hypothetical protein
MLSYYPHPQGDVTFLSSSHFTKFLQPRFACLEC